MHYMCDIVCLFEMKHCCNIALPSIYINILAPKWKGYVEKWCFGKLSNMLRDEKSVLDNSSITELVKCFDTSSEDLEVRCGVYINLRTETPSLFHHPSGPFEFKHHRIEIYVKYRNKHLDIVNEEYN